MTRTWGRPWRAIVKIPKSYNEIRFVSIGSKAGLSKKFRSKNSFLREKTALTWLAREQNSFKVPNVIDEQSPELTLELIEHTAPASEEKAWRCFGNSLAELHTFHFNGPAEVFPDDADIRLTISGLLDKAQDRFPPLKSCADTVRGLSTSIESKALKKGATVGFTHRDPNRGNFFFYGGEIYLVDFEHCHPLGDIREDLVLAEIHSGKYWGAFLEGYGDHALVDELARSAFRLKFLAGNLEYITSFDKKISPKRLDIHFREINERLNRWFDVPFSPARAKMSKQSNSFPLEVVRQHPSPSVSIVIPAYETSNAHTKIFEQCLSSIRNHDQAKSFEIIVVDDGSPRPIEVPEGIKLHRHKRNKGRSAARNTGANVASGDVLIFCDSDVFVGPSVDLLGQLVDPLFSCDIRDTLVAGLAERLDENDFLNDPAKFSGRAPELVNDYRFYMRSKSGREFKLLEHTEQFRKLGNDSYHFHWTLPYVFATFLCSCRRSFFERIGGFCEDFVGWGAEDNHFAACAIANGAYLRPTNSPLVYHVRHELRDHSSDEEKALQLQRNQLLSACLVDELTLEELQTSQSLQ